MIFSDFHVHSTYSDGFDDIEAIVSYAEKAGLKEIGIADHSYTFFDPSYCLKKEDAERYVAEINALKEKYAGRIKVLCGIEYDLYSDIDLSPFDYAIGSMHYIKKDGRYYAVDESREIFVNTVEKIYGGDHYAACEDYFKQIADFKSVEKVKIIGHFDLITKFNGKGDLFDENDERYVKAYKKAAEILVKAGKIFEINTGAWHVGLRADAYPAKNIRKAIKDIGGKFILSSDAHKKEDVAYGFDRFYKEL